VILGNSLQSSAAVRPFPVTADFRALRRLAINMTCASQIDLEAAAAGNPTFVQADQGVTLGDVSK
jgi:hypothetical protein